MDLTPGPPPATFRQTMAETYDGVAELREERGEDSWRWPIAERFAAQMEAEDKRRFLEIGAGVGFTSTWFAKREFHVVATDLSPAQVELCRAKGLDAHVRDMYDLGFPAGSFDAAWAMNCVHHIPSADFPGVLQGIADVLVPGGLFYVGVWGGNDREGVVEDDFYLPARFFSFRTDETLRSYLEQVFTVESFEAFSPEDEPDPDGFHMQSFVLRSG